MNKDDKIKDLQYKIELYKQFITLLNGPEALQRIEREYAVERTNEVLERRGKEERLSKLIEAINIDEHRTGKE